MSVFDSQNYMTRNVKNLNGSMRRFVLVLRIKRIRYDMMVVYTSYLDRVSKNVNLQSDIS